MEGTESDQGRSNLLRNPTVRRALFPKQPTPPKLSQDDTTVMGCSHCKALCVFHNGECMDCSSALNKPYVLFFSS